MNVYQSTRFSPQDPSARSGPKRDPAKAASDPARPVQPAAPDSSETSGTNDDYLWDKTGEPDPGIVMLENILGNLRMVAPAAGSTPAGSSVTSEATESPESVAERHERLARIERDHRRRKNAWVMPALGMVALFAIVGYIGWPMRPWGPGTQRTEVADGTDPNSSGGGAEIAMTNWEASHLAGAPVIGTKMLSSARNIGVDQWLTTDAVSRAQLVASDVGTIKVEPNSRVRVTKVLNGQQWFELAKGRIEATINAPPKIVFVKTKSALAVDMGCAYTLETDEQGSGTLHVTLGWVELQRDGRAVRVPRGKKCAILAGVGPGTPIDDAASGFMVAAVARFDHRANMKLATSPVDDVLSSAGEDDGVTLWHVLQQVDEADRGRVIEKLGSIVPPPAGISKELLLKLDPGALDKWWDDIR